MAKPYIIRVSSQKGGVGKTTISTNVATALRSFGYKTLLLDFDFTNPSVGFHMGLEDTNSGIQAAMRGSAQFENVISIHGPTGLHVIPGEIKTLVKEHPKTVATFVNKLKDSKYDFIVADTAPGFDAGASTLLKGFDEDIIVTTPDLPSCASAVRLSSLYDKVHLKHALVINKLGYARYELSYNEIVDMYGGDIVGALPVDDAVPASIAAHIPAYVYKPKSVFARKVKITTQRYAARGGGSSYPNLPIAPQISFWQRLLSVFTRRKY